MASSTTIIVSKANGIRFAHNDGLLPSMGNTLWRNEVWSTKVGGKFKQQYYKDDIVLIQIKGANSVPPTLKQYNSAGVSSTISLSDSTVYTDFTIFDYLVTFSTLGTFYFIAESELSEWQSEDVEIIENDGSLKLIEWTNLDLISNSFEFDYNTTTAIANVNYIRLRGEFLTYKPGGERTVYDNQNEETIIKSSVTRVQGFSSDRIPKALAEILSIAVSHDSFLINDVGYLANELPETEMSGGFVQFNAELGEPLILGINTHDIGFDCDDTNTSNVEVKEIEGATGNGSFSISAGYMVAAVVIEKVTGTPLLKIGSSVSGDEILTSRTVTNTTPPASSNIIYTPDFDDATWTIYYTLSGGTVNLSVVTIPFRL